MVFLQIIVTKFYLFPNSLSIEITTVAFAGGSWNDFFIMLAIHVIILAIANSVLKVKIQDCYEQLF